VIDDRSASATELRPVRRPKPRIALLDPREAVSDYLLSFAMGLKAVGADFFVVATPQLREKLDALAPRPQVDDYPYFALRFKGGWRNGPPYILGWLRTLGLLLRRRPTVLHVQWLVRAAVEVRLLPLLARSLRARLVYTAHNVLPHERGEEAARTLGILYRRCDVIVVHTHHSRRVLLDLWPEVVQERVVVVPHGNQEYRLTESFSQEEARRELGIPANQALVGFIGKIRPYKGVLDLVRAIDRCRDEVEVGLLIAGQPDDVDYLHEVELGIAECSLPNVHLMLRYLTDRQMQLCFSAVDVVVLPYHAIDQSGILLYAMTHGTAIVASRLEGFLEVFEGDEGAVFYEPGDVDGLYQALIRVLEDGELRKRLGRRARELAATNHSWPAIARQMEAIYSGRAGVAPEPQ
jgi:D-inositol-3-phosphate glycosyltransferase